MQRNHTQTVGSKPQKIIMKKNHILLIFPIIIGLLLNSCYLINNGVFVKINNSSNETVTNVIFSSDKDTNIQFDKIEPNQSVRKYLDMSNNTNKGDGNYILCFTKQNGKRKEIPGGYYTNGHSLNSKIICEIKTDTVTLK